MLSSRSGGSSPRMLLDLLLLSVEAWYVCRFVSVGTVWSTAVFAVLTSMIYQ